MKDTFPSPIDETSEQKMIRMEQMFSKTEIQMLTDDIKSLLIWAYENYDKSFKRRDTNESMYWDGYIRALHHVLEMEWQ
jgi:hypothetical protein